MINIISFLTLHLISKKIIEFGLVGLIGIKIQVILFYLLNFFNNKSFIMNNFFALIVGTLSGYCLNNQLTFNNVKLRGNKFIIGMLKFLLFSTLTIAINISVSYVVYLTLKLKIIAIFSGILSGFLSNFFLSRKLVWGD